MAKNTTPPQTDVKTGPDWAALKELIFQTIEKFSTYGHERQAGEIVLVIQTFLSPPITDEEPAAETV